MPQQVFKGKVLGVTAERQSTQWVTWQTRARSTRGTRQRQCWALIYSQADTAHRSWGQLRERLRVSVHGHLRNAWKRTPETKLNCCYRPQVDVLRVNLLVTHQLCCITHWHRCEEIPGNETGSRLGSGLWLPDEMSPCNSSPRLSSCSNPCPGCGHTWNFGHTNLAKFPETGWTSHLQQTSGVSCSWGYLNLGVSGRVSRCFAIRQSLTSFQQLFSTTAHVILPTFFSTKRSSSLPGKISSFPTKHYTQKPHSEQIVNTTFCTWIKNFTFFLNRILKIRSFWTNYPIASVAGLSLTQTFPFYKLPLSPP